MNVDVIGDEEEGKVRGGVRVLLGPGAAIEEEDETEGKQKERNTVAVRGYLLRAVFSDVFVQIRFATRKSVSASNEIRGLPKDYVEMSNKTREMMTSRLNLLLATLAPATGQRRSRCGDSALPCSNIAGDLTKFSRTCVEHRPLINHFFSETLRAEKTLKYTLALQNSDNVPLSELSLRTRCIKDGGSQVRNTQHSMIALREKHSSRQFQISRANT